MCKDSMCVTFKSLVYDDLELEDLFFFFKPDPGYQCLVFLQPESLRCLRA